MSYTSGVPCEVEASASYLPRVQRRSRLSSHPVSAGMADTSVEMPLRVGLPQDVGLDVNRLHLVLSVASIILRLGPIHSLLGPWWPLFF
jgi:hypothetical protein